MRTQTTRRSPLEIMLRAEMNKEVPTPNSSRCTARPGVLPEPQDSVCLVSRHSATVVHCNFPVHENRHVPSHLQHHGPCDTPVLTTPRDRDRVHGTGNTAASSECPRTHGSRWTSLTNLTTVERNRKVRTISVVAFVPRTSLLRETQISNVCTIGEQNFQGISDQAFFCIVERGANIRSWPSHSPVAFGSGGLNSTKAARA